jgi:hypothetical protein
LNLTLATGHITISVEDPSIIRINFHHTAPLAAQHISHFTECQLILNEKLTLFSPAKYSLWRGQQRERCKKRGKVAKKLTVLG